MRKSGFSLSLIIVSNLLIIIVSLFYGMHIFSDSSLSKSRSNSNEMIEEFKDLTIKKTGLLA